MNQKLLGDAEVDPAYRVRPRLDQVIPRSLGCPWLPLGGHGETLSEAPTPPVTEFILEAMSCRCHAPSHPASAMGTATHRCFRFPEQEVWGTLRISPPIMCPCASAARLCRRKLVPLRDMLAPVAPAAACGPCPPCPLCSWASIFSLHFSTWRNEYKVPGILWG